MTTNQSPVGSTPPPAPEEKGKTLEEIIFMALGESSALFMSQGDTPAKKIVMPTEELTEIGNRTVAEITKHYARIEGEREELLDSLRDARDFIEDCAPAHGEYVLKRINPIINKYPTPSPTEKV